MSELGAVISTAMLSPADTTAVLAGDAAYTDRADAGVGDGMSYLLIPLVQRPVPELAPLRENLRSWVSVVSASADACLVLDCDGRVAGMSERAAALVAEDVTNIVGRRLVGDVFALVDFSSAAEPIGDHALVPSTQAIQAGVLSRGLVRLRRADGLTVTLDAIATPLHGDDGSVLGSLTFLSELRLA